MTKRFIIALTLLSLLLGAFLLVSCNQSGDEVTLSGIRIAQMPDKTTYFDGESFDKTGLNVLALYSDGTRRAITAYALDKNVLKTGDESVTVSYKGFTETIVVTVLENAVKSLEIQKMPDKTAYYENDAFDPAGIAAIAHYENGSVGEIPVKDLTFDKDTLSSADAEVVVSYKGVSAKIPVSVKPLPTGISGIKLVRLPVKTVYCENEDFDPTGIAVDLCKTDGSHTPLSAGELTYSQAKNGVVTVSFSGFTCEVAVRTVEGSAKPFVSDYSDKEYRSLIASHTALYADSREYDNPFGSGNAVYANLLDNPRPDGVVKSRKELVDYVDYHAFYYVTSIVVKPDYAFSDFESELDYVYYNSTLIASTAAIQCEKLSDGWYQIKLKFYTDTLVSFENGGVTVPKVLTYTAPESGRTSFVSSRVDYLNGVSVNDSEQLCSALAKGYKVAPIPGSAAEKAFLRAYEILTEYCTDTMDAHEKMIAIARYMLTLKYDDEGEMEWASRILSVSEPDMLTSQLVSFHAEGPLFYGNAACFGYAKAFGLLLSLEDIDFVRVVGRSDRTKGRVPFDYSPIVGYDLEGGFSYHSYLYVHIDGKDYIADGTYAFAGSLPVGGKNVTIHRQLGVGLTKEIHSEVYTDIIDDYSFSGAYRPDPSYDYMRTEDLLIDSSDDLKNALDTFAGRLKESSAETLEYNLIVSHSLSGTYDVRSEINAFCKQHCTGDYGFYLFTGNTHGGKTYNEYLIIFTR